VHQCCGSRRFVTRAAANLKEAQERSSCFEQLQFESNQFRQEAFCEVPKGEFMPLSTRQKNLRTTGKNSCPAGKKNQLHPAPQARFKIFP